MSEVLDGIGVAPRVDGTLPSVFIMTHSHPKLTRGGAEISANTLFRELKARGATAWLMGVASARSALRLGATLTQPYGPDDFVYHPNAEFDYFKFANPDPQFPRVLEELMAELRPDIVHSHHFVRFGVESFAAIKRGSPGTRIVLSLHEYLAICNHHGQMMKTRTLRLCEKESYAACAACFPQHGERDFFLRKRYIQMFFDDVDLFVSPSHFLADRFRSWGLPPEKLTVLENMPPERPELPAAEARTPAPPRPAAIATPKPRFSGERGALAQEGTPAGRRAAGGVAAAGRLLRFGFFGQMSPLKGILVLMDAAKRLDAMGVDNVVIEIYGDYSSQPPDFQKAVKEALEEASENVVFHGVYDNAQVNDLMRRMDAIVMPSTWWENSPVVIQEAFTNGRPVICSNIGGMAEKVTHGVNGLHFEVSRPASLAAVLAELAEDPGKLSALQATVTPPPDAGTVLDEHLTLYRRVMN
ncbi:glycosyltransferase family 4 protein [Rhizosaccharibacter radicis]|uniref:Glycosyltransferase family 4 protein n=1 Tax=Rhizosaccharibacter radicis TaxID=2782605 RepID=A0ABT1VT54_9PROT|nr:glycosyltransferase family 4 protein [Acetobacteraceae bacterium KSS12]